MADVDTRALFDLTDRVAVITGGGGLLGRMHAQAILEAGGVAVLGDIDGDRAVESARSLADCGSGQVASVVLDVTDPTSLNAALASILDRFGRLDILINNAARNPTMGPSPSALPNNGRLEQFPLSVWNLDLAVGLTGAFLCSQVFGGYMARRGGGVIVNVASDLALIAPDQRIYRQPDVAEDCQPAKPVSYPVVKAGLVMLTKYLATYWARQQVRVNSLSPGGVLDGQSDEFVGRLTNLIPMGRMAERHEYRGAILFLCSDASSYMTGANLVIDGGRTCW